MSTGEFLCADHLAAVTASFLSPDRYTIFVLGQTIVMHKNEEGPPAWFTGHQYHEHKNALTLPLGLSVYGFTGQSTAVVTARTVLLFGRQIIPAECILILFHFKVRLQRGYTLPSMESISALTDATAERHSRRHPNHDVLHSSHSVPPRQSF
jgi:hypothetical protein